MYINLKQIIRNYDIQIKGAVHIGAHKGEELFSYYRNNIKNIILIEANKKLIRNLNIKKYIYNIFLRTNISLENFASYSLNDQSLDFNIMNNTQSSSILDLKTHKDLYPLIHVKEKTKVQTKTLDWLFENKYDIRDYNFLNMDIQGSELETLKGSVKILKNIDVIYTEINFDELYHKCALAEEMDNFLSNFNFKRVLTKTPEHHSWGDALYIKMNKINSV
jgi:FkbM family methyltransferase